MATNKINTERWYTLQQVVEGGFLTATLAPWKATYPTVRNLVLKHADGARIFAAQTRGKGTNVRYLIKGENIARFIKAVATGTVRL